MTEKTPHEMLAEGYSSMVRALAKPGVEIAAEMNAARAHVLHMAVGIAGEAGQLLDAIKKHVIYGKELDLENVIEELGDLEFYMDGLRQGISVSREECLSSNIQKLGKRYASGSYTDQQAQERADKQEDWVDQQERAE